MLLLTSTADLVRVVTSAAADIEVHASWVDNLAGAITPGRTNTASITTATTTTVVASPAASTQRNVKHLNIYNNHASISCVVTVEHTDGTTAEVLWEGTLAPSESIVFSDSGLWLFYDALGKLVTATGPLYVQALSGDQSNSTTTLTEVTGLSLALPVGTYQFQYAVIYQAAATTTGVRFSVNFTGTVTSFVANVLYGGTSGLNSDAAPDQDQVIAAAAVYNAFTARAKSTAGWGTTISVDTINADMLTRIDGTMVVTVAGDIELWHGSEVAAASTVKAGSSLVVTKVA